MELTGKKLLAKRIEIQNSWNQRLTNMGYINPKVIIDDDSSDGFDYEKITFTYDSIDKNNRLMTKILKNKESFKTGLIEAIFNEYTEFLQ